MINRIIKMQLYDHVCKNVDGTEELLTGEHCSKISMMSGEVVENIYLLILHHFVTSHKGYKQKLMDGLEYPYGSKLASKDGKGLTFKVSSLPEDVQRIVVRYLRLVSA